MLLQFCYSLLLVAFDLRFSEPQESGLAEYHNHKSLCQEPQSLNKHLPMVPCA